MQTNISGLLTIHPNKIGINPRTDWEDTPYGIYAYTVKYVLSHGIEELPFAGEREYIWVFKARNPKKIRYITDSSKYKFLITLDYNAII